MKYTQKSFSVAMPGNKGNWPWDEQPISGECVDAKEQNVVEVVTIRQRKNDEI